MTIRARIVEASTVTSERPLRFPRLSAGRPGKTAVSPSEERAGRLAVQGQEGHQILVGLDAPAGFESAGPSLRTQLTLHGQRAEGQRPQPLEPGAVITLGRGGRYYLLRGGGLTSEETPDGTYQSSVTLTIAYNT